MTQKPPIHRNFVQMSGYKDIFYNPLSIIKKNPPSPIETSSPLIKKSVIKNSEIDVTYETRNTMASFRPNLINKRKVNSKDKNFIFSPSPEKLSLEINKNIAEYNNIYENIKSKIIDIMFYQSSEKKFDLINDLITLLKQNDVSEEQLCLFLKKL